MDSIDVGTIFLTQRSTSLWGSTTATSCSSVVTLDKDTLLTIESIDDSDAHHDACYARDPYDRLLHVFSLRFLLSEGFLRRISPLELLARQIDA